MDNKCEGHCESIDTSICDKCGLGHYQLTFVLQKENGELFNAKCDNCGNIFVGNSNWVEGTCEKAESNNILMRIKNFFKNQ